MTCNIGKIDRIIRGVVGAGAVAWGVMNDNLTSREDRTILVITDV